MTSETSTIVTVGTHLNGEPFHLNLEENPHVLISASNNGNHILHTIQNQLEHRPGWGILVLNKDTVPNLHIANQVMTALAEACEDRTGQHAPLLLVAMENADDLLLAREGDEFAASASMLETFRKILKNAHEAGIYFLLSIKRPDAIILNEGVRPFMKNRFTVGHHGSIPADLVLRNIAPSLLNVDDTTTSYAVINGQLSQFTPTSS